MTTTEHLQLIKAECERLLAIAEKRTQGEWECEEGTSNIKTVWNQMKCLIAQVKHMTLLWHEDHNCSSREAFANATYIAACAGRAEAGWRATIAAINMIQLREYSHLEPYPITAHIIAAWPIELLTNKPQ
jgi:hypothetical protein